MSVEQIPGVAIAAPAAADIANSITLTVHAGFKAVTRLWHNLLLFLVFKYRTR